MNPQSEKENDSESYESVSKRIKKEKVESMDLQIDETVKRREKIDKYLKSKLHNAAINGKLEDFKLMAEMVEDINPQGYLY